MYVAHTIAYLRHSIIHRKQRIVDIYHILLYVKHTVFSIYNMHDCILNA